MSNPSAELLVVDDLEDWRTTIRGVLQDSGYKVSVAGSSQEAVSLLSTCDYDLALLDLRLDETNEENVEGLTLAQTIRDRWPRVKIVIFTGHGSPEIVQKSMQPDSNGERLLDDFLPKENTDRLIQIVERVLST